MFKKNAAVTGFAFAPVHKTTGAAITTGSVTGYVTIDGGVQAAIGGTPVHEGNGQWTVNLTAAEMNGSVVGLLFVHADAAPLHFTISTLDDAVANKIADHVLKRTLAAARASSDGGSAIFRSLLGAAGLLVNKREIDTGSGKHKSYEEDDTTLFGSQTYVAGTPPAITSLDTD